MILDNFKVKITQLNRANIKGGFTLELALE